MTIRLSRRALLTATLALAPAAAFAGERPITPEEFRQIDEVLRREGFTRWGNIEFDGGRFQVADALANDGRTYNLRLSGVDFSVASREPRN